MGWDNVYYQAAYGADQTHIQLDAWNTMMQVTGITLWEDPNHPESWLRDATLDYWNVSTQSWVTGPPLLSDQATHTHAINPPHPDAARAHHAAGELARSIPGWARSC